MHKFPFPLPILATTKPATPVTVLATTATNALFTNAPLVSAGNQVTTRITALFIVALSLLLHPTLSQQHPIGLLGPHATLHCPLAHLVALIHLTPGLTALLSPTKTTRTFMRTLVEMASLIVLDGVTSWDPLVDRTLGIFESFVIVSGLTRG